MAPHILIITGFGLNCEAESREAWRLAGADVTCIHLNDLLDQPRALRRFQGLMFIGGFSYGDHMTSGHVLARRLLHRLRDELDHFIEAGHVVMGVCNGFQTLTKMGLLPGFRGERFTPRAALLQNDNGLFRNAWIELRFEPASPCIFTRNITRMQLPIRHGEGKLFAPPETLQRMEKDHHVACRYIDPATGEPTQHYPHNPNGALHAIAGLCDATGRVFGLMPHPEAYLYPEHHPHWDQHRLHKTQPGEGEGLKLFRNAIQFLSA